MTINNVRPSLDDSALEQAQREVENHRMRVEDALNRLEDKIQLSVEKVGKAIFTAKAPIRFAQRHPAGLIAGAILAGFFVSTMAPKWSARRQGAVPEPIRGPRVARRRIHPEFAAS